MTKGKPIQALATWTQRFSPIPPACPRSRPRQRSVSQGELDKASIDLSAAVEFERTNVMALSGRAGVWIQKGDPLKALADLDAVLKIDPSNVVALVQSRRHVDEKGRAGQGSRRPRRRDQGDPTNVPASTILRECVARQGQREQSSGRSPMRRLKSEPTNASALAARANLYLAEGKLDEARQDMDNSLRFTPDHPWMRHELPSCTR